MAPTIKPDTPEAVDLGRPAARPARRHAPAATLQKQAPYERLRGIRSRLTSRGQTTLPRDVLAALGLQRGVDEIEYELQGGQAIIRRAGVAADEDPVLLKFLDLIERDLDADPRHLQRLPAALYTRWLALTDDIDVDPDEFIDGPVALSL